LEVTLTWVDGMQFAVETGSRHTLTLDTAKESGGNDSGPRPMEMLLVGLGGCTGVDVLHILKKMRQEVTGVQIRVRGKRATEHPRVYTDIEVEYTVSGRGLSEGKVRQAVKLSETTYCSASAMLSKTAKITSRIHIVEDGE
jgi:putative redox protein